MSDSFHEMVSFSYIERVFDVIEQAHHHSFQILTKRAVRMAAFCRGRPNPWLGVFVENRKYGLPRIDVLRGIDATIRFLSVDPSTLPEYAIKCRTTTRCRGRAAQQPRALLAWSPRAPERGALCPTMKNTRDIYAIFTFSWNGSRQHTSESTTTRSESRKSLYDPFSSISRRAFCRTD